MTSWTCFDVNSGDLGAFKSIYLLYFEKYSLNLSAGSLSKSQSSGSIFTYVASVFHTVVSFFFPLQFNHCEMAPGLSLSQFFFWRGRICQDCF